MTNKVGGRSACLVSRSVIAPYLEVVIRGTSSTFEVAASELSDADIDVLYGVMITEALWAFEHDPTYLIDMAEHASTIAYKRAVYEVRSEVLRAEKDHTHRCSLDSKTCPFVVAERCSPGKCRWTPAKKDVMRETAVAALLEQRGIRPPVKLGGSRRRRG